MERMDINCVDQVKLLAETEIRSKDNTRRLEKLEERVNEQGELIQSVQLLAQEQEHIKSDVSEIKADVKSIADKPKKRWEAIGDKLLWLVIGGVAAWVMSQIGLPV